jgi:hypothetical protein
MVSKCYYLSWKSKSSVMSTSILVLSPELREDVRGGFRQTLESRLIWSQLMLSFCNVIYFKGLQSPFGLFTVCQPKTAWLMYSVTSVLKSLKKNISVCAVLFSLPLTNPIPTLVCNNMLMEIKQWLIIKRIK